MATRASTFLLDGILVRQSTVIAFGMAFGAVALLFVRRRCLSRPRSAFHNTRTARGTADRSSSAAMQVVAFLRQSNCATGRVGLSVPRSQWRQNPRKIRIPEKARPNFVTTAVHHSCVRLGRQSRPVSRRPGKNHSSRGREAMSVWKPEPQVACIGVSSPPHSRHGSGSSESGVGSPPAHLTHIVPRLCLDRCRSARARKPTSDHGCRILSWIPWSRTKQASTTSRSR